MKISKPEIFQTNNKVVFQCQINSGISQNLLWYSVNKEFGDFLTTFSDGPLVALLFPAMKLGEDLHVEGIVSE